ncbi:MAG: hypothetical protein IT436_11165 [Phycisphaerales bacterium]|nr:hypothetical protein [Phycisphaerales bacterium]
MRTIHRWAAGLAMVHSLATTVFGQAPGGAAPAPPRAIEPASRKPPAKPAGPPTVEAWFHTRIEAALDRLETGGDFAAARADLTDLLDRLIAHGSTTSDVDAFREVVIARRLVSQLTEVDAARRAELLRFLRQRPGLSAALAFAIKPEAQKPAAVYAVLQRLRAGREDRLESFATLTAALCVVLDRPWWVQVNENKANSPGPEALFDYYAGNEGEMAYGIRGMPVELLVHVIAAAAPIEDLNWARARYKADRRIENRYREIKYDYAYFNSGGVKKVTAAGWSLKGIVANGGVCADQAYFAMTVAQSMGIPAAYVTAQSGEVGHAWVGYLEANGKSAAWNFDAGRFGPYLVVRGNLVDPQTRERVSDASVAVMARGMVQKPQDRQDSEALFDAAVRMMELERAGGAGFPPAEDPEGPKFRKGRVRRAGLAEQQELIEAGLRRTPSAARGWRLIGDLAETGRLTLDDKKRWAEVLCNLCGKDYPYFSFEILKPMILTVGDLNEQDGLWTRTAALFAAKADLVSEIRLAQGRMWENAGDNKRAWGCYQDVIKKYVNAGPFVVDAVERCEGLLADRRNTPGAVVDLYQSAWRAAEKPGSAAPEFRRQSNWYRLGVRYIKKLEAAGKTGEAAKVKQELER